MVRQTLEGTWEEVSRHATELAGRRVRVQVLDDVPTPPTPNLPPGTTLAELMKDYIGSVTSPEPHDDARRAEEIWGQGVLDKHLKNQERKS